MNQLVIVSTSFSNSGGVANHFRGLHRQWNIKVEYIRVGSREGKVGWLYLLRNIYSLTNKSRVDTLFLLNPSIGFKSLVRDTIFTVYLSLSNKEVAWLVHGWNPRIASIFFRNRIIFKLLRNKKIIVLASEFQKYLNQLRYNNVHLSTTKVDDSLIDNQYSDIRKDFDFSFIGRLVPKKGALEMLKAVNALEKTYGAVFNICIAGEGPSFNTLKEYASNLKSHVYFPGYLRDKKLGDLYSRTKRLVLPSVHHEGLPTVILEALCFGIPVIATKNGGIVDVVSKQNGVLLPLDFTIEELKEAMYYSAQLNYNTELITKNADIYRASCVAKQLEGILNLKP